ncbi:hypothetical protein QC761_600840 [Podospora bellae-mahoneyi]|uniref:Ima1 N-terminal domain-containing protein n=1 Tax=Podospora bellae-mahoneyi TaxID=2093777 RepID=A0ABR0FC99_9PEZI|nr:hypothetical protein QC761_600840 [Podospora bellae-mahoneyi]
MILAVNYLGKLNPSGVDMADHEHSTMGSGGPVSPGPSVDAAATIMPSYSRPFSCPTKERELGESHSTNPFASFANSMNTFKFVAILSAFFRSLKPASVFGRYRIIFGRTSRILAAMAGFAVTCVALWTAICAMEDSRKALRLAEWTAKKEFLEFCQTSNFKQTSCQTVKTASLDPPPTPWIVSRMYRREIDVSAGYSQDFGAVLVGFPFTILWWAIFSRKVRRIIQHRYLSRHPRKSRELGLLAESMKMERPRQGSHSILSPEERPLVPPPISFGTGMAADFDFSSPLSAPQLDLGLSTGLERYSRAEAARRKRLRTAQSPAEYQFDEAIHSVYPVDVTRFIEQELKSDLDTHNLPFCWKCEPQHIDQDGKLIIPDLAEDMLCSSTPGESPLFCHDCGDSLSPWLNTEDSEEESHQPVVVNLRQVMQECFDRLDEIEVYCWECEVNGPNSSRKFAATGSERIFSNRCGLSCYGCGDELPAMVKEDGRVEFPSGINLRKRRPYLLSKRHLEEVAE